MITYPKNQSLEASDTFQAGQKQRAGYVPTYASATISSAEHLTILERYHLNIWGQDKLTIWLKPW